MIDSQLQEEGTGHTQRFNSFAWDVMTSNRLIDRALLFRAQAPSSTIRLHGFCVRVTGVALQKTQIANQNPACVSILSVECAEHTLSDRVRAMSTRAGSDEIPLHYAWIEYREGFGHQAESCSFAGCIEQRGNRLQ